MVIIWTIKFQGLPKFRGLKPLLKWLYYQAGSVEKIYTTMVEDFASMVSLQLPWSNMSVKNN